MTVIALIPYKDGVLLVADSRQTHFLLGMFDVGHTHTQKLIKLGANIIVATAGEQTAFDMAKSVLKDESASMAPAGLTDAVVGELDKTIKEEIRRDKELRDRIKSFGGATLLGVVKPDKGAAQPFRLDIRPSGVTWGLLSISCDADGVPGTLRELRRLMRAYGYDPSTASEFDAEFLGYKLVKRMEKDVDEGAFVGDPIQMCAMRQDGTMKAFMVETKDAFKKDASGRDDWDNKHEMAELKLTIDKETERALREEASRRAPAALDSQGLRSKLSKMLRPDTARKVFQWAKERSMEV